MVGPIFKKIEKSHLRLAFSHPRGWGVQGILRPDAPEAPKIVIPHPKLSFVQGARVKVGIGGI